MSFFIRAAEYVISLLVVPVLPGDPETPLISPGGTSSPSVPPPPGVSLAVLSPSSVYLKIFSIVVIALSFKVRIFCRNVSLGFESTSSTLGKEIVADGMPFDFCILKRILWLRAAN